mmetsp:Transcript_27688/g.76202  ORF Transcript_27688/g.76202 Transcript_27688/m.76202 type:complete len:242 (+) Transcript_27688:1177-1902(+)
MATLRCIAWNLSRVTGSSMRMILSRASSGSSKPSNSALEKAATSVRQSLPSWSESCFSKEPLRSRSFFRAAALAAALALVELTTLASFSTCLRPPRSFPLSSSISLRTLRAASQSPISFHLSSKDLRDFSSAALVASRTFSTPAAASAMASGVPLSPSVMPFAASCASVTFPSVSFTSSFTSFTSLSTFSASSFARRSFSTRRRSSSARFSLMLSMRSCACWSVSCASCVTFCAWEPSASR